MKTNLKPNLQLVSIAVAFALFAALFLPVSVFAQEEYRVSVNRNIGFSSGSQIRGDFTISLSGPVENVASVTFLLDGQEMTTVVAEPFRYRFMTQDYPDGIHEFSARVTLKDGSTLETALRRFDFVSSEDQTSSMVKIIFPLLGITLLLTLIGGGATMLGRSKKGSGAYAPGQPRSYGLGGGAICPKCKRPTPTHMWGLNLVAGRLDRCENCGGWSLMRRQPIDVLRAAEAAELESEKPTVAAEKSEEEKLREMLDRSRYNQ